MALDASGQKRQFVKAPSDDEWKSVYVLAKCQCVLGIAFAGIKKLPEQHRPAKSLLLRWVADAQAIRCRNQLMNRETARLTMLFDGARRQNVVLKGQANAALYPDPLARQPGDIDIWVGGGRDRVYDLLVQMKLLKRIPEYNLDEHHIHLPKTKDEIDVEVHFKPAFGNPVCNDRLQDFLNEEICNVQKLPEGFYAPSIKFALVMQLSHLQQHFYTSGIGLRQFADYLMLLRHSSEKDRKDAFAIVKKFYMKRMCGAVMWVLKTVFGLERKQMLCEPDCWRGKKLLKHALYGGDFGRFASNKHNVLVRCVCHHLQRLVMLPFDPVNVFFVELKSWRWAISLIPFCVRQRKIDLRVDSSPKFLSTT